MSFWTSLRFLRPTPPPVVNASDIGRFLLRLGETGLLADKGSFKVELKYGDAINQDSKDTIVEEEVNEFISAVGEYDWDNSVIAKSLSELAATLADRDQSIYRAYVSLGDLTPPIAKALTRDPCDDNSRAMWLTAASFSIGPIFVHDINTEVYQCGWFGLTLSGQGNPFPWTNLEVIERARAFDEVLRAEELCRDAWPITEDMPIVHLEEDLREVEHCIRIPAGSTTIPWLWGIAVG